MVRIHVPQPSRTNQFFQSPAAPAGICLALQELTFGQPGDFRYFCTQHPEMSGLIIVER
ncbi:MAG: hypothetical protein HY534_00215 [Chloroflexi bacterium]|nr:hypothetical protein [Chloroflexota bacterium]